MRKKYETLHVETIDEHILLVMYDRPEVRNAKNTQMGIDQRDLFGSLYVDLAGHRVVVLTGRGEKAFSAGGGSAPASATWPACDEGPSMRLVCVCVCVC